MFQNQLRRQKGFLCRMNNVKQFETKDVSSRVPEEYLCILKKYVFYFERDTPRCCALRIIKGIKGLKMFQLQTLQLVARTTNCIHNQTS